MNDIRIGQLVRVYGEDEHGRTLDGMTGVTTEVSPLYCDVALTAWPGVTVRMLRSDLVVVDPFPQSARSWRHEHLSWEQRNRRVIARMQARRAA